MLYPTMAEVDAAGRHELCRWSRFLPSPGMNSIGHTNFQEALDREELIMTKIWDRLNEMGGFTPEISKSLGWERP